MTGRAFRGLVMQTLVALQKRAVSNEKAKGEKAKGEKTKGEKTKGELDWRPAHWWWRETFAYILLPRRIGSLIQRKASLREPP
jgi:hypothetical protein